MTDRLAPERILMTEGSVELPVGFEDFTTNVLKPADPATLPNLGVSRDTLGAGEALPAYVDRQLADLKRHLPSHRVLVRAAERLGQGVGACAGERIDATYAHGGRRIHQRQAAFAAAPPRVLVFSATCPKTPDARFEQLWRRWLDGFQTAATSSPSAAATPDDPPVGSGS